MKRRQAPRNVRSIDDRLKNRAAADGVEPRRLRHRLAVIIVADALQASLHAEEKLVIKGGTAMMLRFSFGEHEAAAVIDSAVKAVIDEGFRTGDIFTACEGQQRVGTSAMGDAIVARI